MLNIIHRSKVYFLNSTKYLVFASLIENLKLLVKLDSWKLISWWSPNLIRLGPRRIFLGLSVGLPQRDGSLLWVIIQWGFVWRTWSIVEGIDWRINLVVTLLVGLRNRRNRWLLDNVLGGHQRALSQLLLALWDVLLLGDWCAF